jgi:arginase
LQGVDGKFDLVLSYPQWQGSGRSANLLRGAHAAAEVCGQYGPLVQIPLADEGQASGGINRWSAILEQFRSAQAILDERRPRHILTAGGDCACDIAVIDYMHKLHPDLIVIWIDAHLDANTAGTSPSGNFHGMPVGAIMGSAPPDMLALLGRPLVSSQFRYVSAHMGDEGDWAFQQEKGLSWLESHHSVSGPIHIHFDLDVLDPAEFPHLAYPDGNLSITAALKIVSNVGTFGNLVSLTITEFAPGDDAGVKDGSVFIRRLCEAAGAR